MTDPAVTKLSHRVNGFQTQQGYLRQDVKQLRQDVDALSEAFQQATDLYNFRFQLVVVPLFVFFAVLIIGSFVR
jgi:hypothetical protein